MALHFEGFPFDRPRTFPSVIIPVFWTPRTTGTRWAIGFFRNGKSEARKE